MNGQQGRQEPALEPRWGMTCLQGETSYRCEEYAKEEEEGEEEE
jgi:hypothetical protein